MKTIVFAADELYHNQDLDRLIHAYITSKYPNLHYERLIGNERNQNELQAYLLNDEPETGMLFPHGFTSVRIYSVFLHSSVETFS